jgi:hypothetical protein
MQPPQKRKVDEAARVEKARKKVRKDRALFKRVSP